MTPDTARQEDHATAGWGIAVLVVALTTGLGWLQEDVLVVVVAALVAVGLLSVGARRGGILGMICTTIALSASAVGNDSGVDPFEVLFGLSLVLLAGIGCVNVWMRGRVFLRTPSDVALALYLVAGLGFGCGMAILNGAARSPGFVPTLFCLVALALFFVIRDVIIRIEYSHRYIIYIIIIIGLYASVENVLKVKNIMSDATQVWQIVDVRTASGEIQMLFGFLFALLATAAATGRRALVLGLVVISLLVGGLVVSKSRGAWVAAVVSLSVVAVWVPSLARRRMLGVFSMALPVVAAVATLVLGPRMILIGMGFLSRATSVSAALTNDPSLLNRYVETNRAMDAIAASPVMGHGWGSELNRYDMILHVNKVSDYIHNGYIWIAHKIGIISLILFIVFLIGLLGQGVRLARHPRATLDEQIVGIAGMACLVSAMLLALPSNPFAVLDQVFMLSLAMALVSGLYLRVRSRSAAE